jgi:hypothetical protein
MQEVEMIMAAAEPESPASTEHLMEAICDPDNIEAALDAVLRNKGAPGIDGITVKQLGAHPIRTFGFLLPHCAGGMQPIDKKAE